MFVSLPLFERLSRKIPVNEVKAYEPEAKVSFGLVFFVLLYTFFCAPSDEKRVVIGPVRCGRFQPDLCAGCVTGIFERSFHISRQGKAREAVSTDLPARVYAYTQSLDLFRIIVDFTLRHKLKAVPACSCITLFIGTDHGKDGGHAPIDDSLGVVVLHNL